MQHLEFDKATVPFLPYSVPLGMLSFGSPSRRPRSSRIAATANSDFDVRGIDRAEASASRSIAPAPVADKAAPSQRYDRLSRFLHWSVALGIVYTAVVGYAMHLVSNEAVHHVLSVLNMSVATVITALMAVRFVWRYFRPAVEQGGHGPAMQKKAAEFAHELLYLIVFVVLISGFLMLKHSFDLFFLVEFPRVVHDDGVNDFFFMVHRVSCIALVGMVLLHLAAVFKHQKIDKYPIMQRMT